MKLSIKRKINLASLNWRSKISHFCLVSLFIIFTPLSQAKDIRYGLAIGAGGASVEDNVNVLGLQARAQKSEGPGVFSFYLDNLVDDSYSFGVEYSAGFRIGPFSSGISFLGLTSRWYFFGPALFHVDDSPEKTTLFSKRLAYFYGLGVGVANANVNRTNDLVQNITASGIYFGPKIGMDYSVSKKLSYRYEAQYYSTFLASASAPKFVELAVQFGIFYFY